MENIAKAADFGKSPAQYVELVLEVIRSSVVRAVNEFIADTFDISGRLKDNVSYVS